MEYNIIIRNDNLEKNKDLIPLLFDNEDILYERNHLDMYDILVNCKLFTSKSNARKNWNRTGKEIPEGFTDLINIGKLNHRLTIWNPKND